MFDGLTERLTGVFDRLSGRGVLSAKDIDEAMREVRVALLEADVALPVVRGLIGFVGRHGLTPFAWYRIAVGLGWAVWLFYRR